MSRVDAAAEKKRQEFITSTGPGQAMVYMQKFAEAAACLADASPDPSKYPLLNATIGIDGDTVVAVAESVRSKTQSWLEVAAQIEKLRIGAKRTLRKAEKTADVIAAYQSVDWSKIGQPL